MNSSTRWSKSCCHGDNFAWCPWIQNGFELELFPAAWYSLTFAPHPQPPSSCMTHIQLTLDRDLLISPPRYYMFSSCNDVHKQHLGSYELFERTRCHCVCLNTRERWHPSRDACNHGRPNAHLSLSSIPILRYYCGRLWVIYHGYRYRHKRCFSVTNVRFIYSSVKNTT